MENAIYTSLSREIALQRQMEVVANNIANMNTAGFRSQQVLFQTYMAEPQGAAPDTTFSMVIDQAVVRDLRAGAIIPTDNPLDVAVRGEGYLVVETPAGPRYTRNGHLSLDAENRLVDSNGLPLLDVNGTSIQIPNGASTITISPQGDVSADDLLVSRLALAGFDDELAMSSLGGGLYATNELPREAQNTELLQGSIENSNVSPIVEMTRMIEVNRQYQAVAKLIQDDHELIRTTLRRIADMTTQG